MACIIDSCSLLNLIAAWPDLAALNVVDSGWNICDATTTELKYRNVSSDSGIIQVPLDLPSIVAPHRILAPKSELEQQMYIVLASQIDEGEAMSMALAKSRGLVLVTDDKKAIAMAARNDIDVPTRSTVSIIRDWTLVSPCSEDELRDILVRVRDLAKFIPTVEDDAAWWRKHCF